MQSRRSFLRTSALGLGAVSVLPQLVTAAESAATPTGGGTPVAPPLVDWHSHVVTVGELELLGQRKVKPRVAPNAHGKLVFENVTTVSAVAGKPGPALVSDLATRIQHLDQNGIQRQLLTYTVASGYEATIPVDELRPFYRRLNDDLAEILRQHPGRFLGVAAVPTADSVWAAQELARGHQELGLIGAAVPLNAFASTASARTQAPLFAAAQKFGSHIFVHRAPGSPGLPDQPPLIVPPTDFDRLRWSVVSNTHLVNGAITLALSDFLDPYPDVSVQVIMLGGFFPYLLDSVVEAGKGLGIKDPLARLRRIYLEPGPYSSTNGEWVAIAAAKFGADRILFGTDYGVGGGTSADRLAPSLVSLNHWLTPAQRQLIYVDNTRALLKAKGIS
jgi:predicted TIM-barrel fold metal-dependent hydrolase